MQTKHFTVMVHGIPTPVISSGDDNSLEAVVYLHGNPGGGEDFKDLVPATGSFVRSIAPDMPGFGAGGRPKSFPYTVEAYVEHLNDLLKELNIINVHLVLHDIGGLWGLEWATRHAKRVKSITLINTGITSDFKTHPLAKLWRKPVVGELAQLLAVKPILKYHLNQTNIKPLPEDFIDRIADAADLGHKKAVLKFYRSIGDSNLLANSVQTVLAPKEVPTLVIWGEQDSYLAVENALRQKDYFDAEVHTLPESGHWPMIDAPKQVEELVVPFLRQQV